MKFTVTQAAREWGISKPTIYKRLESGELSAEIDDKGRRVIDASELARVFGDKKKERKAESTLPENQRELIQNLKDQLSYAQRRIESLEQAVKQKDNEILNLIREVHGTVGKLLEHDSSKKEQPTVIQVPEYVTPKPPQEPEKKPEKKRGLFGRVVLAALDT